MIEIETLRARVEDHAKRITELEIEATFHRRANEELDEVVREQALRLDQLERRIAELIGELQRADADR